MPKSPKPPAYIAKHIRTVLMNGGSAPHTIEVQRFFKHEVQSRGWYTAELRKVARRFRRAILAEHGLPYLIQVADQLFHGEVLEEKNFAVMLLEGMTRQFGRAEFKLFESWLDRVSSWADHDALVHYLIGPMVAADDAYLARLPVWAKKRSSPSGIRRAAAVSLIHSTRQHKNFDHIQRVTEVAPHQRRRHGAEGTGLAAARSRQSQSRPNRRLPDDHSRSYPAPGVAHGLRDAACSHARAGAGKAKTSTTDLRGSTRINSRRNKNNLRGSVQIRG